MFVELVDHLAVAADLVVLADDLDLVVLPLAARLRRADLRRCRCCRTCRSSPSCASRRSRRRRAGSRGRSRSPPRPAASRPRRSSSTRATARRLLRVREAHEDAAVGVPAVRPALAELELEPEVPEGLDRVPQHAQAADRRDAARSRRSSGRSGRSGACFHCASEASEPSKMTCVVRRPSRSSTARRRRGTPSARCPSPCRRPGASSVTSTGPVVACRLRSWPRAPAPCRRRGTRAAWSPRRSPPCPSRSTRRRAHRARRP